MRRSLSALMLGLSLVVGSIAWAGFVLTRTALDPGRSEVLADQILENEQLRSVLANRIAEGLQAASPAEVPLPRAVYSNAANLAFEDPAVQSLVRDGLVQVHQNALLGVDQDVALDATAIGSVARSRLIETNPELDAVLPRTPEVVVELPTGGLSVLGTIRTRVEQVTFVAALVAAVGAIVALGIAKNRPAVLRRVAFWAFGTSLFWLALGFGIPFIASQLAPASGAVIAAVVEIFFSNMIPPAVAMAAAGAMLVVASWIWGAFSRRRGTMLLQPQLIPEPRIDLVPEPPSSIVIPQPVPARSRIQRVPATSQAPLAHRSAPPAGPQQDDPAIQPSAGRDSTTLFPTALIQPRQKTHIPAKTPPSAPAQARPPAPAQATTSTQARPPAPAPAQAAAQAPARPPSQRPAAPASGTTARPTAPASTPSSTFGDEEVTQETPRPLGSHPPRWVPGQGYVDAEPEEDKPWS